MSARSGGRRCFFLDTSVLVYSFDESAPQKRVKAQGLIEKALTIRQGMVSYQVVQEFLNAATRKFTEPFTAADARIYLDHVLWPLCRVFPTIELYRSALDISNRWGYAFYDSLILAGALEAGCDVLYSEDLQHRQVIAGLTIIDPFRED